MRRRSRGIALAAAGAGLALAGAALSAGSQLSSAGASSQGQLGVTWSHDAGPGAPGQWLAVGFTAEFAGGSGARSVSFGSVSAQIGYSCDHGNHATGNLAVGMGSFTWQVGTGWTPVDNPKDPSTYQGATQVPNLCGDGSPASFNRSDSLSGSVQSSDSTDSITIRPHAVVGKNGINCSDAGQNPPPGSDACKGDWPGAPFGSVTAAPPPPPTPTPAPADSSSSSSSSPGPSATPDPGTTSQSSSSSGSGGGSTSSGSGAAPPSSGSPDLSGGAKAQARSGGPTASEGGGSVPVASGLDSAHTPTGPAAAAAGRHPAAAGAPVRGGVAGVSTGAAPAPPGSASTAQAPAPAAAAVAPVSSGPLPAVRSAVGTVLQPLPVAVSAVTSGAAKAVNIGIWRLLAIVAGVNAMLVLLHLLNRRRISD